jgi:hypothetical protein
MLYAKQTLFISLHTLLLLFTLFLMRKNHVSSSRRLDLRTGLWNLGQIVLYVIISVVRILTLDYQQLSRLLPFGVQLLPHPSRNLSLTIIDCMMYLNQIHQHASGRTRILNWFLENYGVLGACTTSVTGCPPSYAEDQTKKSSRALVRQRTIPTEQPPLVGEVSANFNGHGDSLRWLRDTSIR